MMTKAKLVIDGKSILIGVEEARANYQKLRGHLFCRWCGETVHVYPEKEVSTASALHFGHVKANPACSSGISK